ncbi:MAG: T9SS type A sorting domain-containing protein [Bacteroidales bacterium]|nr:T9SS type A sorting domain-containing protein [Bacteroidales bacterium]
MKHLLVFATFISTVILGNAQVVRIQFEECNRSREAAISKAVSLDSRNGCLYTAYANPQELAAFEELGIPYELAPIQQDNTKGTIAAAQSVAEMEGWNMYPSYSTYLTMMQQWATNYPNLCKLDTVGYSYNNHLLLCMKISDNPTETEAEPEFFYMSSMHGDEVTGFYFLLRMIDTLLTSYGTVEDLTQLVNTTQIYIMPDANPDGTYKGGDNYVWQPNMTWDYSGRYNGNGEDLNRTYPDPFNTRRSYDVQYNATEQENKAMIQYMNAHHFVMAACMHGGAEILNFPWDSYTSSQKPVADAAWWTAVGNRFVATLREHTGAASNSSSTFPNNLYRTERINGSYTEQCFGGDWYAISGGWQDYANWYNHIRAFTIEVSRDKCPAVSGTWGSKNYWSYQREPLINIIKEVHEGVHGFVVDSLTREPLKAFIQVLDHDCDSSQIYSRSGLGDYYRPIANGTYSFRASCPGYITKTYTGVTVSYGNPTDLLIELIPGEDTLSIQTIETSTNQAFTLYPNPTTGIVHIQSPTNPLTQSPTNAITQSHNHTIKQSPTNALTQLRNNTIKIYSLYGQLLQELPAGTTEFDLSAYTKGTYILRVGSQSIKIIKF